MEQLDIVVHAQWVGGKVRNVSLLNDSGNTRTTGATRKSMRQATRQIDMIELRAISMSASDESAHDAPVGDEGNAEDQ